MRYAITQGIVFDSSEPEYLLIAYGAEGFGRLIGQFPKLEDAFIHLHERKAEIEKSSHIELNQSHSNARRL
jgi:hypothetical protein